MKVKRFILYEVRQSLFIYKEKSIKRKPRRKMFVDFKDFNPNVLKFLKK